MQKYIILLTLLLTKPAFSLWVGIPTNLGIPMPDNTPAIGISVQNKSEIDAQSALDNGWTINGAAEYINSRPAILTVSNEAVVLRNADEVYWLTILPAKYKIQNPDNTWREMTDEEKKIVDAPLIVTNIVQKPSSSSGAIVQEAEQIYTSMYMMFFGDMGYTNSSYMAVAAQIASVAVTNDAWAARSFLMDKSFTIIDEWWVAAKQQLELNQPTFHPYPWGLTSVTNIVEKAK